MAQIIETCSCGCENTVNDELREFYGTEQYFRCQRCGETLIQRRSFPWVMMLLALVAAVWGWVSVTSG